MPRFAANLSMMFTEVPFIERFAAARKSRVRCCGISVSPMTTPPCKSKSNWSKTI